MKLIQNYFEFVKNNKKYYVIILYLIAISSIVGLVYTLMLKVIIDDVLVNSEFYILPIIVTIMVLSFIINTIINYCNGVFVINIMQNISIQLKQKIVDHIQKMRMNKITDYESGDLINRTKNDIDIIAQFLSTAILTLITNLSNLLLYSIIMFYISKKLAIFAMLFGGLQLFISQKFSNNIKKISRKQKEKESQNLDFLAHLYKNIKFYKAFNKYNYNNNKFLNIIINLRGLAFDNFKIKYFFTSSISFITYFASIILIGIGIYEISKGRMTIGILFVFDSINEKFYQYSNSIMNFNIEFQNAYVSMERVNEILSLETENYDSSQQDKEVIRSKINTISIRKARFKYTDKDVIHNVNFEFNKNQAYMIMGPSGQGKTTLVNLILKLYELQGGYIDIGGVNIKDISVNEIRKKITYVMQENVILNDSIRENLLIGDNDVSEEVLEKICKICHIEDFVQNLEKGYETVIGEKGIQLSEGQKQRISLARGLLRESDIYIFDEITSHLDNELGVDIVKNIQEYRRDKIKIYITHNSSIKEYMDEIIILNDATIQKCGSF
ncbi:MAG: ABC transporter ATP-binding protein [Lachnotalea sp.]